ncbi:iron-containing alcohol dehydrogenase [Acutalibacter intestini]|uniref:iron-containing alcohol dehydrogenase n=1 Tax=Acutalibacter intestini TaxID=3093659 RepID=UPI002AC936D8|nr:iron-containing alcohol dehydrogenase [Acutalibacter sp. M00204]
MIDFNYYNPTEIIFGQGRHQEVGEQIKARGGRRVLFHYGGGSIKRSGLYEDVCRSLQDAGLSFVELGGVQPNPRVSLARKGIALCREENVDYILAVGGGSVIDSAKAISAGMFYDGDVWDFYLRRAEAERSLPIGVVLTIPAAGSETGGGSVITNEDGNFKRDYGSNLLMPQFAILNPALCRTVPQNQISAGSADILAHVMERYFTNTPGTDLIDRLCESTMRSVMLSAVQVKKAPQDVNAWSELMWGGTIAHCGLLGTGRQQDWASHNIEHELSAQYGISHGTGLAIIFPAWMKYVYKINLGRFVQFAVRVLDVDLSFESQEAVALEGIARLEAFFRSLDLPVRLSEAGIGSQDFDQLAKKACDRGAFGGFKKMEYQDVMSVLKLAE